MSTIHVNPSDCPAFASFLAGVKRISDTYMAMTFPTLAKPNFRFDDGLRYIRVVRFEGGITSSVHCFIDKTNGDVLKAESWKRPARHARGNIFNPDNGLVCMGPYGASYLR